MRTEDIQSKYYTLNLPLTGQIKTDLDADEIRSRLSQRLKEENEKHNPGVFSANAPKSAYFLTFTNEGFCIFKRMTDRFKSIIRVDGKIEKGQGRVNLAFRLMILKLMPVVFFGSIIAAIILRSGMERMEIPAMIGAVILITLLAVGFLYMGLKSQKTRIFKMLKNMLR